MKLLKSWGFWIAVLNGAFVLGMLNLLFFSFLQKNDLVEKNYYNKGLAHQEQINKIERTKKLTENIRILQSNRVIALVFPKICEYSEITGNVLFYRTSNAEKDIIEKIKIDSAFTQNFILNKQEKGLWKIKVDWKAGELLYYFEQDVYLN
jgi:hypothetical protein